MFDPRIKFFITLNTNKFTKKILKQVFPYLNFYPADPQSISVLHKKSEVPSPIMVGRLRFFSLQHTLEKPGEAHHNSVVFIAYLLGELFGFP
jgi:hypothetical protein